jgi:hypothetical protein
MILFALIAEICLTAQAFGAAPDHSQQRFFLHGGHIRAIFFQIVSPMLFENILD